MRAAPPRLLLAAVWLTGFPFSFVIPGRAAWREPGIHTPAGGYGFQARASHAYDAQLRIGE
jgi:hypothetical protein